MSTLDSNSNKAQGFSKAFDEWNAGAPSDSLWNKLNDSISAEKVGMVDSFDNWDAGSPNSDLWSKLDESIATEKVWQKLDDTLKANGSDKDAWLVEAHSNWSAATNLDGWDKLQEELSRERVWRKLENTLKIPVALDFPWFKVAASILLFFSLSYYMSDGSVSQNLTTSNEENTVEIVDANQSKNNNAAIVNQNDNVGNNNLGVIVPINNDIPQDLAVQNNHPLDVNSNNQDLTSQEVSFEKFNDPNLGRKDLEFASTDLPGLREFALTPKRPSWTLSVGTQLSLLTEENRSAYTNSLPKFGIAADLAFNKNFNRLRLTQSIGYSQFAQGNGKYINGRYLNTQQRLSAVQLNTTVGYQFNRFAVNGGLVFTRLINGTEQQQNTIVNVYNVSKIQPGLTAGFEYNFRPLSKQLQVGFGVQYQWVPQVATSNVVFNDIQGIKLQTKISF